jgi:ELWxxDGT repeat protein
MTFVPECARRRAARTSATRLSAIVILCALGTSALGETPGVPSSDPEGLIRHGDRVYFTADDGVHGRELWCTDGTAANTRLLLDATPGPASSQYDLRAYDATEGDFQFVVRRSSDHVALYRTDGSTEGTQQIKLFATQENERIVLLGSDGKRCYYNVVGINQPSGLWVSNGTPEGTAHIPSDPAWPLHIDALCFDDAGEFYVSSHAGRAIFRSRGNGSELYLMAQNLNHVGGMSILGGKLLFKADTEESGGELWVGSPVPHAHTLLMDIGPGSASGGNAPSPAFQGFIPFIGNDGTHGNELWRTDGTAAGTKMIADINPGVGSSEPYKVTPVGHRLFFVAMDASHGRELWASDGTAENTVLVHDVNPGLAGSDPYAFAVSGDRLFFSALNADRGEELWVAQGDPLTAHMVRDIAPGTGDSAPYFTVALGENVLFAATSPDHGRELWISDGTAEGTRELMDLYVEPYVNPGSHPTHLTPAGNRLYFVANDMEHGAELWCIDQGTEAPRLVRDIFPGTASSNPRSLIYGAIADRLFFVADDGRFGEELWQSDGTEAGTTWISDLARGSASSAPTGLVFDADGMLYFTAYETERGYCIFRRYLDAGVHRVLDTWRNTPTWRPRNLQPMGTALYFTADDGVHGEELWVTADDTTKMVRDILPAAGAGAEPFDPVAWNGRLYFSADDRVSGRSLWHTVPHAPYAARAAGTLESLHRTRP